MSGSIISKLTRPVFNNRAGDGSVRPLGRERSVGDPENRLYAICGEEEAAGPAQNKYQASKSTSNKRLKDKRDKSLGLPHSEFLGIASTFSGLVLSLLFGLTIYNNTSASSINITLTGNANLNLVKSNTEPVFGTTASNPQIATITSDHFTGYTLTIAGQDDIGSLKGANDNTKSIPSIQTAISESTFRNDTQYNDTWGFLPNKLHISGSTITNENYQPAPKLAGTTIDVTTSPTSNEGNKYNLALGAKVTPAMALDSYSGTFVLAATGNGYDYFIGYTDDLNDMPENQYGTNSSETYVNLSSTTPVKAGYIFKGWCDQKTTNNGTTCPGTTYPAGQRIDLNSASANHYDLHAIWEPVTFAKAFADASATMTMQNMTTSICNAVAIGQEGTLTDTRGGSYRVGKMADGRCWMLDNLALGGSSPINLTTSDTNIATNWTLPASISQNFSSFTDAQINADSKNDIPSDEKSQAGQWKIGVYYNYCAATAGTYCPAEGASTDLSTKDICPKGWRLPSGGTGGEFSALYAAYGSNYDIFRTSFRLPLSGHYYSAQIYDQGISGRWLSSTFHNSTFMYNLRASTSGIYPRNSDYRISGFSVRCISK